ncbi:MAG: TOBE domain-containing protein, partial [Candidatus Bathyarchaeia archaeon]
LNGRLGADEKGLYTEISDGVKVRIPSQRGGKDMIHLAIKAQDVILSRAKEPPTSGEENLFEGRIIDEIFEGANIIYEVALTENLALKAVTSGSSSLNLKVGDRVYVTLDPHRMVILEE